MSIKEYFLDFVDLIYPDSCVACRNPLVSGEEILCVYCEEELAITDYHKDDYNPIKALFYGRCQIKQGASFLHFSKGGRTQEILHALKYKNMPEVGVKLGSLMADLYKQTAFFKSIDILIPVPLHPKKLKKRGYNQSTAIAEGIQKSLDLPIMENALIRVIANSTQTKKSRFARWKNVESIFKVPNPSTLQNKHILLIDDVITTGATLEASVLQLLTIPGVTVSVVSLAYAE